MMKKILRNVGLIAISLLGFSGLAIADPAAVIKDGSCGIPTPTGSVSSDKYHKTITFSNTGVAVLKCKVKIEDYLDGQFHDAGFLCGINVPSVGFFNTTDTMVNISQSGVAMLTCKVKTNVTP